VYYETGGPEVFRYEDVPDPVCDATGVLIDVGAISIEGGDTLSRARGDMAARPHIVGYQCAGVIRAVGEHVRDRTIGQRVVVVMMHGSHAARVAVPAPMTWVLPDGLDLQLGACVPIAVGTADDCLFEFGRLRAGETVLIHAGASGVGSSACGSTASTAASTTARATSWGRCKS
jgi:NADPH2:quinone reductase